MMLFILFCLPAIAFGQCLSENDDMVTDIDTTKLNLARAQHQFSVDVLKILNENQNVQNIFFSPYSIYNALLLAYIAAGGELEKTVQRVLHIPETQSKLDTFNGYEMDIYEQYKRAQNKSAADFEFTSGSKIYYSSEVETRECMRILYCFDIECMDFKSDPAGARNKINEWVQLVTMNQINNFLSSDAVHENTRAILVNAAYFKGLWKSKFTEENTKNNALFYVSTNDIRIVDLMVQRGTFNHMVSEKLKAHILQLPYKGDDVSMIVMLPRFENNAVDRLIDQLDEDSLKEIIDFDGLYPRQVEVELPKFSVEQSIGLRPVLEKMGLTELFSEDADFTTLTVKKKDIHFTDAIHKAKIEVDEKGTVAAAATAIFTFRSSRPSESTKFVANHPFVYFIYDRMSKNILFMGVYRVPDKKYRDGKRIIESAPIVFTAFAIEDAAHSFSAEKKPITRNGIGVSYSGSVFLIAGSGYLSAEGDLLLK